MIKQSLDVLILIAEIKNSGQGKEEIKIMDTQLTRGVIKEAIKKGHTKIKMSDNAILEFILDL